MNKDILLFLMIRQADIFVDGHGTTPEDDELIRVALLKDVGVTEDTPEEELEKMEKVLEENKKLLAIEYREKLKVFLEQGQTKENNV